MWMTWFCKELTELAASSNAHGARAVAPFAVCLQKRGNEEFEILGIARGSKG